MLEDGGRVGGPHLRSASVVAGLLLSVAGIRLANKLLECGSGKSRLEKFIRQANSGNRQQQPRNDAGRYVSAGPQPLAVFQHFCRFPSKLEKGSESAAATRTEMAMAYRRKSAAIQRKLPDEAKQETSRQIDEQRAYGTRPPIRIVPRPAIRNAPALPIAPNSAIRNIFKPGLLHGNIFQSGQTKTPWRLTATGVISSNPIPFKDAAFGGYGELHRRSESY